MQLLSALLAAAAITAVSAQTSTALPKSTVKNPVFTTSSTIEIAAPIEAVWVSDALGYL